MHKSLSQSGGVLHRNIMVRNLMVSYLWSYKEGGEGRDHFRKGQENHEVSSEMELDFWD